MRALNKGREITLAMADMFSTELRGHGARRGGASNSPRIRTSASVASATDWWLGVEQDSPRRMPADEFVAHLTTIMVGSINGTCELLGIKIDPDLPLHEGVRRREHVA